MQFILLGAMLIALLIAGANMSVKNEHETSKTETTGYQQPEIPSDEELEKLPPDGGNSWNRLVFEQSPYLLQHAANPVDWRPWGDEAFEAARDRDKLVFLSIGYSTCHWCHVMERESFEDEEVAALINEHFIPIKVDREERPDIDQIYMTVCQAMTGGGGWPLTVFLTPDRKPIFAGTYFAKRGAMGRPGMMELLPQIAAVWKQDRARVLDSAQQITDGLRKIMQPEASDRALSEGVLETAFLQMQRAFDDRHGGFGQQPKFPTPYNYMFLLRYAHRYNDEEALNMATRTLRKMRLGGMYDHVGFGFHRYSTDREWLVPHFEKMLYDQAMLGMAYVEAYQKTKDTFSADTAREIFRYVIRDMTSFEGGFYSAEDADSEGVEGKFYVWTAQEVRNVLGEQDAELWMRIYNFEPDGNFLEESTGHKTGENIPHLGKPLDEWAEELDVGKEKLRSKFDSIRQQLFEEREKRVRPLKDDKILTDWNGLMIAAMAKGGRAVHDPELTQAAERAAQFLLKTHRTEDGDLLKRSRKGKAGISGVLDDYAFLVWGLLELYESTFEVEYLREAITLNDRMIELFWDNENGGFYLTANGSEALIVRGKEIYDGAVPSGNSVAALNQLRIGRMTGNPACEQRVNDMFKAFGARIASQAMAHTMMMCAVDFATGPSTEIVIAGEREAKETTAMQSALADSFLPNTIILFRPTDEDSPAITAIAPFTQGQKSVAGKATAYVCHNYACKAPATNVDEMMAFVINGK